MRLKLVRDRHEVGSSQRVNFSTRAGEIESRSKNSLSSCDAVALPAGLGDALKKARASGDHDLARLASWVERLLDQPEHPDRARARLLAEIAALPDFAGLSRDACAHEIEARWARYAAGSGHRDRGLAECPRRYRGKPEAVFWQLHRMGLRPIKYRHLFDILPQK